MGMAARPLRYPRQGELFRHFCRPSRGSFSRTAGESSLSSSFSSSGRNWEARAPRQLLPCRAFLEAMSGRSRTASMLACNRFRLRPPLATLFSRRGLERLRTLALSQP